MAEVSTRKAVVTFVTDRMPNSTELKRLLRALDCLYYASLFSGEEPYQRRPGVWRAWVDFGFGTGLQQGPPFADDPDRIKLSTFSNGKELTFTVSGGHPNAFNHWMEILQEVEQIRPELADVPGGDRVAALLARGEAVSHLSVAIAAALANTDPEDRSRVERAIRTALGALTFPIVKASRITAGA
jgi:hypothetical protein